MLLGEAVIAPEACCASLLSINPAGPGIEQNYATAKEWYEKAIAADDRNSYIYGQIGRLYEQGGPGLEQDLEQACSYYQKVDFGWQEAAEKVCSR